MKPLGHPGRRSLAVALVICVCAALLTSWPMAHGARREAAPPSATRATNFRALPSWPPR